MQENDGHLGFSIFMYTSVTHTKKDSFISYFHRNYSKQQKLSQKLPENLLLQKQTRADFVNNGNLGSDMKGNL